MREWDTPRTTLEAPRGFYVSRPTRASSRICLLLRCCPFPLQGRPVDPVMLGAVVAGRCPEIFLHTPVVFREFSDSDVAHCARNAIYFIFSVEPQTFLRIQEQSLNLSYPVLDYCEKRTSVWID